MLLISSQQTAYVANRYITESGRLISDLLGVTEKFKSKGYLVTTGIKKTCDSIKPQLFTNIIRKIKFCN